MKESSLGSRLFRIGQPNPAFALSSTVNWMRALAILTQDGRFDTDLTSILAAAGRGRETRQDVQDLAFEKLFLARSYVAALRAIAGAPNPHDVARMAIVAWYYSVYFSSQGMLAITAQPVPDEHRKTARVWLRQLVTGRSTSLIPYPFDVTVTSLVKATADQQCEDLGRRTGHSVNVVPATIDQAHDAHVSYLSGCAAFYREKEEDRVRTSADFQDAGYKDFRRKSAQDLRDARLAKKQIGFLDMAFRYRGKANYRDALFLCYGAQGADMNRFLADAFAVAQRFHSMCEKWVSRHVPPADWERLVADLRENSKLTAY